MQAAAADYAEWVIDRAMFWEGDKKRKGHILRAAHNLFVYVVITLLVLSHTIYPAFWLQTLLTLVFGLIWVQHIVCRGCVIWTIEHRWTGDTVSSILGPVLELFHIENCSEDDKQGVVTLISTLVFGMLLLGWTGRLNYKLRPVVAFLRDYAGEVITKL